MDVIEYLQIEENKISYISIDLQKFAEGSESKTEKATPKKRQEARKKGQVLQSKEITAALVLLAVFVILKIFGGYIYFEIVAFAKRLIIDYPKKNDLFTVNVILNLYKDIAMTFFKISLPVFLIAIISGVLVSIAQVGFLFTTETLGFKFERINPLSGLKRIFSTKSIFELGKATFKIVVVIVIAYFYLKDQSTVILNMMDMNVMNLAINIAAISINVAIRMCIALIILALFDYGYQWWDYEKSLKMSKQELKEEYKQTEGNPQIKSKIKQKQREMSLKRMMNEIPKADVVITNPTHFAVAIKYEQDKVDAPKVIAKGQDYIALRIKEIAKDNKIEIVENKPLARTIYETVDIGEAIPPELYQAVAEVLAFVYSLKNQGRAG